MQEYIFICGRCKKEDIIKITSDINEETIKMYHNEFMNTKKYNCEKCHIIKVNYYKSIMPNYKCKWNCC